MDFEKEFGNLAFGKSGILIRKLESKIIRIMRFEQDETWSNIAFCADSLKYVSISQRPAPTYNGVAFWPVLKLNLFYLKKPVLFDVDMSMDQDNACLIAEELNSTTREVHDTSLPETMPICLSSSFNGRIYTTVTWYPGGSIESIIYKNQDSYYTHTNRCYEMMGRCYSSHD